MVGTITALCVAALGPTIVGIVALVWMGRLPAEALT